MKSLADIKKPGVAIYPGHYLAVSMTFIYRQLIGISNRFRPIVFASSVDHLDLFPFDPIYLKKKAGYVERVYYKFYRRLSRRYGYFTRSQWNHWKDLLEKHEVKLIHAHFGPSGLEILPLAKALGIPLLVTFRGYDASSLLRNEAYLRSLRELFNDAHILTVSRTMAEKLIAIGADPLKIKAHYNGIPIDDFCYVERRPIPEKIKKGETLRFLQVSNFVEKKGHQYTVMAFREFLSSYPNSLLTLAGSGSLRPQIETLCRNLGISDRIRFAGKVSQKEVIDLMTHADLFLHHSITGENGDQEGIPNVLAEAMAMGLPVVSTYHAGIHELVRDGIDGLLVREKDVKDYVNKLSGLLESDIRYGENGAERVRNFFNLDKQNKSLGEIYGKMISEGGGIL